MTAWPLIWSVAPTNPNWEGTVGDQLSFSVSAMPDPTFPDGWDYGDELNPNPLPPPPTNIQVSLVDTDLNDEDYYNVTTTGASVSVDDVVVFLPFTSIKFEKDEQVYQVQYEQELRDFGFDFVFEFIPFPKPFDTRFIQLRATSTWTGTLNGTFIFRINNNFDAVRSALLQITEEGESFLSSIEEGDGTPTDFDESEENGAEVVTPTFGGKYVEPDEDELFPTDDSKEIDRYVRDGDMDEVEERIGNGSGLTKTPKTSTRATNTLGTNNPNDEDLENWFDDLGR